MHSLREFDQLSSEPTVLRNLLNHRILDRWAPRPKVYSRQQTGGANSEYGVGARGGILGRPCVLLVSQVPLLTHEGHQNPQLAEFQQSNANQDSFRMTSPLSFENQRRVRSFPPSLGFASAMALFVFAVVSIPRPLGGNKCVMADRFSGIFLERDQAKRRHGHTLGIKRAGSPAKPTDREVHGEIPTNAKNHREGVMPAVAAFIAAAAGKFADVQNLHFSFGDSSHPAAVVIETAVGGNSSAAAVNHFSCSASRYTTPYRRRTGFAATTESVAGNTVCAALSSVLDTAAPPSSPFMQPLGIRNATAA